jgi:hypothetical protein
MQREYPFTDLAPRFCTDRRWPSGQCHESSGKRIGADSQMSKLSQNPNDDGARAVALILQEAADALFHAITATFQACRLGSHIIKALVT